MPSSQRWKHRPPGSNWGEFGMDDQRGRLNLLTPARVRRAVSEVQEGLTFCLSLPLDYPGGNGLNPRRHPSQPAPTMRNGKPNMAYALSCDEPGLTDVVCDDVVMLTLQYSTQWDALSHFGQEFDADGDGEAEIVFYNGYRGGEHIIGAAHVCEAAPGRPARSMGAYALGIENMATSCVQGRGVMVDFKAHFGRERVLVGYDTLMRILEKDRVTVEEGDLLCVRTGFDEALLSMRRQPDAELLKSSFGILDGRDDRLLQWITDSGIVALICDNNAVEASPSRPATTERYSNLPLHAHCLFRIGVHLGEFWFFQELADWLRTAGRSRFLLTAPPLRLPHAVGSPATPVATV